MYSKVIHNLFYSIPTAVNNFASYLAILVVVSFYLYYNAKLLSFYNSLVIL